MANAKLCLKSTEETNIQKMLESNETIMALTTLIYVPVQSIDELYSAKNQKFYISKQSLEQNLEKYPTLKKCILKSESNLEVKIQGTNILSYESDVSLQELLQDYDFKGKPDFIKIFQESSDVLKLIGNNSSRCGYNEELSINYYLSQGRPMEALYQIMKQNSQLNENLKSKLYRKALATSIYHIQQKEVLASCCLFLEELNLDSSQLKIDVEVARRLIQQGGHQLEQTIQTMLGCVGLESQKYLYIALKQLEESTGATSEILTYQQQENSALESPLQLVALFCKAHNLPQSLTLLHELARKGEWCSLLYLAQVQECNSDVLQRIVQDYIMNKSLNQHLLLLVRSETKQFSKKYIDKDLLSLIYYSIQNDLDFEQIMDLGKNLDNTKFAIFLVSKFNDKANQCFQI